jgi:lycopene beta-cyclase
MIAPSLLPNQVVDNPRARVIPSGRLRDKRRGATYEHLILGAGCAGLSLAWHLRAAGDHGPMALVDRRDRFENDRTWCYWDVESTPFDDLATHAWDRWAVIDEHGKVIECCSKRYRYRRVRSIDVYRRVLNRLVNDPEVDLYLGETIRERAEDGLGVTVETPFGSIRGVRAFESARGSHQPVASAPGGQAALVQHFLGQTVRANRPIFDAGCPILMDFRVDQADGPHFVYVLPLSPEIALVENTYLFPSPVSASRHRAEIASYLDRCFGLRRFELVEEEAGRIPMTTHRPKTTPRSRIIPIGLAGGAARPSSGYAFVRIQRQCRRLASGISAGKSTTTRLAGRKYDFLDTVFLRALEEHPDATGALFARMFEAVRPDSLVRFLGDHSDVRDDLRLIAALPKWPFLDAAVRSASTWLPLLAGRR